jgi:hypothetical protein
MNHWQALSNMNKLLTLFLITTIMGCSSSPSSDKYQKDSLNTTAPQESLSVKADTIPSNSEAPKNKIASDTVLDFTNTVFRYASETNLEGCEFRLECDCCSSELVFLDDSVFYLVDYCVEDASVTKGTYFITDGYLIMKSGNISVHNLYNRKGEDTDNNPANDYTVSDSIIKPFHIKFSIESCESGIKLIDKEEPQFVAMKSDSHPKTIISNLEEWGMMKRLRSLSKKN